MSVQSCVLQTYTCNGIWLAVYTIHSHDLPHADYRYTCMYIQAIGTVMHNRHTKERGQGRGLTMEDLTPFTVFYDVWTSQYRVTQRLIQILTDMYKYLLILPVNALMWTHNRILSSKPYTELFNTLATCMYAKTTIYYLHYPSTHNFEYWPISVYSICGYVLYNNCSWAIANTLLL